MPHSTTPPKKSLFGIPDLSFWRDHLSFIVLIPYIMGGVWQILELASISLGYIRFFSVTQSVADGLLVLIVLFLVYGSWIVWKKMHVTEKIVRKWLMTSDDAQVEGVTLILTMMLSLVLLLPLLVAILWVLGTEILFLLLVIAFLWRLLRWSGKKTFTNPRQEKLFGNLRLGLIILYMGSLVAAIPITLVVLHHSFIFPEKANLNLQIQRRLVMKRVETEQVNLLYYNDRYAFWEVMVDKETDKRAVIVTNFNDVVGDSITVDAIRETYLPYSL